MVDRKNVLVFTSYYLPGYKGGGPIKTISSLVDRLSSDFQFYIFTTDRDLGAVLPYQGVPLGRWCAHGDAHVFYAKRGVKTLLTILKEMKSTSYSVVYLNSFFSPYFTIFPLLINRFFVGCKKPIVLAPRGEFSKGALEIKSRKKALFISLARFLGLWRGVKWQATSAAELEDIVRVVNVSRDSVFVAANIVPSIDKSSLEDSMRRSASNALQVCYLSRVAEIKNLHFALSVLSRVKHSVCFDVYGPCEDVEYWRQCQQLIESLPENISVQYLGGVPSAEVRSVLGKYDLFFVPSKGENFGHVFVEALSAGVPILVSDQTPWRSLQALGVGWDISLSDAEKFVAAIDFMATADGAVRREIRRKCLTFADKLSSEGGGAEAMRDLFSNPFRNAK